LPRGYPFLAIPTEICVGIKETYLAASSTAHKHASWRPVLSSCA
jgi:hypothetical protein